MSKLYKVLYILLAVFLYSSSILAQSSNRVKLQFQRTGTNASSVTVHVIDSEGNPINGASANVECSVPFKGTTTSITTSVLCPDKNGNSSPNYNLTVSVTGLPANFSFNHINVDLHAFNGGGKYQSNEDGNPRQYNLEAKVGKTKTALQTFGRLSNFDAAAGVGAPDDVHKIWSITNSKGYTTETSLVINFNVTAGNSNKGCFLGFSDITLTSGDIVDPTPDPEPKPEPGLGDSTAVYNIVWKNTTSQHMAEEADGSVVVTDYDVAQRIFWKLIPTKNPNCYYIQNTATGRYIGSCNMPVSSDSYIKTTETPVEYYAGKTASTNGEIDGCYYFTSTDCPNYDNENAGPNALNKAGSSNSVITWQAGGSRIGSYWKMVKSEDLYEVRPFLASAEVGKAGYLYVMTNAKGQALEMAADGSLSWQTKNDNDAQIWYFVGTSSRGGGYLLVNQKNHQTLSLKGETDTRWVVAEDMAHNGYNFRPFATKDDVKTNLTVEGESALTFHSVHTKFARHNQIYELPCGTLGGHYLTRMNISGEVVKPMQYPLASKVGTIVTTLNAPAPSDWYTIYSKDEAVVAPGQQFVVYTKLNAMPLEGQTAFLYCDWNHDGIFEASYDVNLQQESETKITVPAEATPGKVRLRFRLTDNGMTGADEEVTGQIFDCLLQVVSEAPAEPTLTAVSSSEERGTVSPESDKGLNKECEVKATPKGNAIFVCWREGNNVVSLKSTYTFTLDHETHLTAFFSPNTDETISGIGSQFAENNQLVKICAQNKQIKVITDANVKRVLVFTPNGALVAQSKSSLVQLNGTAAGSYIVKVYTDRADKTAKILIK